MGEPSSEKPATREVVKVRESTTFPPLGPGYYSTRVNSVMNNPAPKFSVREYGLPDGTQWEPPEK